MLRDKSEAGEFSYLSLKAWNTRLFLAFLEGCLRQQLQHDEMAGRAPSNPELILASLATYELVSWFLRQEEADRRYLLPEQAAAIARHGDNYLKYLQNLSRLASANFLLRWKVLPKHHEPSLFVHRLLSIHPKNNINILLL